jgi:adenine/guanine phosphoribosyltransferase-like PRPP-binding protein
VSAYWQAFGTSPAVPPFQHDFPARMPDGRFLTMRLRQLRDVAVADLILTQASFLVLDALADWLARALRPHRPEVLLGLPVLGYSLAAEVARRLSHPGWVPVAPGAERAAPGDGTEPVARLRLDPLNLPQLQGRRVVLVNDVLRSGRTAALALKLAAAAGITPVAVAVAMTQGSAWRAALPTGMPVVSVFATPLLTPMMIQGKAGWVPREDTQAWDVCPLFRFGMVRPSGPRLVASEDDLAPPSDQAPLSEQP